MEKIKQIKLIEQPREDVKLSAQDESFLFGGYYCPDSFRDGGFWGGNSCSKLYDEDASCGSATNYCGSFTECTWNLD